MEIAARVLLAMLLSAVASLGSPVGPAARAGGAPANGIAEATVPDVKRPRFILDHLKAMADAMHEGAPVRGYLH